MTEENVPIYREHIVELFFFVILQTEFKDNKIIINDKDNKYKDVFVEALEKIKYKHMINNNVITYQMFAQLYKEIENKIKLEISTIENEHDLVERLLVLGDYYLIWKMENIFYARII